MKNGLKKFAGLFQTGFMIIRMADETVSLVFRTWWQEIEKFSRRDQLGLAWALSQNEIQISHLLPKGVSVREDDDFVYYLHEECQQLRVPAQLLQLAQIKNPLDDVSFIEIKDERLSKVKENDDRYRCLRVQRARGRPTVSGGRPQVSSAGPRSLLSMTVPISRQPNICATSLLVTSAFL